jgi:hypothetical protein
VEVVLLHPTGIERGLDGVGVQTGCQIGGHDDSRVVRESTLEQGCGPFRATRLLSLLGCLFETVPLLPGEVPERAEK